jgi:regulatory protein
MAGTITALEVQQHNKERVNVYLDGTFAFGLSVIEAARLRKGQYLSHMEVAALKAHDVVEKAYERAVKYLGQRPRSSVEIRRYLAEKEVEPTAIDEALTRLESQGYVDDLAFARYWVANRQQFRPRGTRALRFELREKGVPAAVIDEVLTGFDTSEVAYQAAQDKARRLRGLDRRAFREKLGSYLVRRGFDYETARAVTDRLLGEFEEEDAGTIPSLPDDDTEE